MRVLVPIDGSDCSYRALEFATEFVSRFDGTLHVIHVTDYDGEAKRDLLNRAKVTLAEADITDDPEIIEETRMANPRYADRVGGVILSIADERDFDHVVMGHHGTGRVGKVIMGSAAETVVSAAELPATVIP